MVRVATVLAIAATAVSVAPATGSDRSYAEPGPGVVVADLNGDGHQDIANGRGKTLAVQLGHGDGTFDAPVDSPIGASTFDLALGDVNRDGAPDLVGLAAGSVVPLLNSGGGHFAAAPAVGVSKTAAALVVADFNGDGKLDVGVGDSKARSVDVLPGNGDGSFGAAVTTATPPGAAAPARLHLGDLNGDGRPDLATPDTFLITTGDGHFDAGPNPVPAGQAEAVGDLNGDGRSDLVAINTVDVTATVALAQADGGFSPPAAYPTGRGPSAVALGDFTGDGHTDIITGDFLGNLYSVLPGNGDGSFGAPVEFGKQPEKVVSAFVPADFDGDGRTDLLTGPSGDAKTVFTAAKSHPNPTPSAPKAKRAAPKKQFVSGGCRRPREGETIKATRTARMYLTAKGLYGCLVSRGRLVQLIAEKADDFYVKQVQFAGPYVAYSWEGVGAIDGGWYEIALYDLRRGVRIYGPVDPSSLSTDAIGRAYDFTGEAFVRKLVLKPNGSLAWTVDANGAGPDGSALLLREMWKLDSGGRKLLDHGEKIAPASLALKGSRLTWKKAGTTVSSALR